ncbi:MAG: ORC1-type DNA replication protein [Candidatus Aenigmatarchaeota archaeon]
MEQKSLDNVFQEFIDGGNIFEDKKLLTSNYKPYEIPHREKEINSIASILGPALNGERPSNLFIYGKCGTGKTACSHFVSSRLENKANENGGNIKLVYINCKMRKVADTEYRLLARLCDEFGKDVPSTGLPTDTLYEKFFDAIDSTERIIILILDEIDTLVEKTGDEFLYNLIRVNEDLEKSQLSIVGVSNDLSFTDNLDPRVRSSLSEEELLFKPYNATQLQDILEKRAKKAFNENSLNDSVIKKCSALAAQEHGDARRALDLLRVAGELAERENAEGVNERHVDLAESKIDKDRIVETIKTQPRQSQAVLWSIIKLSEDGHEEIQTGDIWDIYKNVSENSGLKTLTQRRISDLISELDLLGVINTNVVSKGRYGRTRIVELAISNRISNDVKNILENEYYFE